MILFSPGAFLVSSLNETKGKLESMFGDWEPITLPYKANHDCFINIIFSSTSYGLVYLDSELFGNEIYRFVSPTNGGVTSYIIPVKKGDTLTQRTVSGTVAAPVYKVMKLFS